MSARYDINSANTNRIVRFRVEPANAADANAALFGIFKGRANSYPHYEQLTGTPTANQELAQLRTNLVARATTAYAVLVGVKLSDDSFATGGLTANFAPALVLEFETDESGVFFNNNWPTNTTLDKHQTTDIVDTVGVGGAPLGAKTKDGLQSLVDGLFDVSYDNGTTGPFGNLSTTGNIVLPDGQVTAGAPVLDNAGGGVPASTSGLTITYLP
jgi:hypothetical protein